MYKYTLPTRQKELNAHQNYNGSDAQVLVYSLHSVQVAVCAWELVLTSSTALWCHPVIRCTSLLGAHFLLHTFSIRHMLSYSQWVLFLKPMYLIHVSSRKLKCEAKVGEIGRYIWQYYGTYLACTSYMCICGTCINLSRVWLYSQVHILY